MTPTLQLFLIISAALFSIGLLAALSRRHAIFILIGIEMMLAAANLNFIAFWRFSPQSQPPTGVMIAIFSIAIAAAENAWIPRRSEFHLVHIRRPCAASGMAPRSARGRHADDDHVGWTLHFRLQHWLHGRRQKFRPLFRLSFVFLRCDARARYLE